MIEKALKTIKEYQMLSSGCEITAAVSGGADSLALLRFLCVLRDSGSFSFSLKAAHINHGLRGSDSDRDEEKVRFYCEKWDVKLSVLHADINDECKKTGEGCEECGRRVRYGFLKNCAGENGLIATAHTLSDCAETVIFNITRGSGGRGCCGIPPVRENIIRPLIDCTRDEIEEYCRSEQIDFAVDKTNFDTVFSRNRIRKNVIPQLVSINPGFYKAISGFVEQNRAEDAFLTELADRLLKNSEANGCYSIPGLLSADRVIITRAVKKAADEVCLKPVERRHIEAIVSFLEKGEGKIVLPSKKIAVVKDGKLIFCEEIEPLENEYYEISFREGAITLPYGEINVKFTNCSDKNSCEKNHHMLSYDLIDYDKVGKNPVFRPRKAGDRISLPSRKVTKTLKKLFNEAKLTETERRQTVVLSDDNGVLWVSGFGADKRCAVRKDCERAVSIKVFKPE